MTIEVGETMPDATLKTMTEDGAKDIKTSEIFAGKKVVLFGVIQNLFDKDPPFTGYEFQTARQLYDVIGRQYTGGLRFEF